MNSKQDIEKLNKIIVAQEARIKDLHNSSNIKFLEDLYLQLRKSQEDVIALSQQLESCKRQVEYQNRKIKELDTLYQKAYLYEYNTNDPDALRDKADVIEELSGFRRTYVK